MQYCQKCERRHHVIQQIKTKNKKRYVITICSYCKTALQIEDYKDK